MRFRFIESFRGPLLILIQFQQVTRGGWLPIDRHGSAQNSVSLLPNTTPAQFTVVAAGQGKDGFPQAVSSLHIVQSE